MYTVELAGSLGLSGIRPQLMPKTSRIPEPRSDGNNELILFISFPK